MKNKLPSLIIGLALLAGVDPTTAQVMNLGIAPASAGQSVLYWPNSRTNYVLQTVANLTSTNWVTAKNAVTVNAAEVTNAAPSGFFRLQPVTVPGGMALIPAGWFTMGDTVDNEGDASPTNIYVSAFFMDVNLVNYGLWTNVYGYATNQGYSFVNAGEGGYVTGPFGAGTGTNYAVNTVDWFDCVKWCNARSQAASLTPAYYTDAGLSHVFKTGDAGTTVYQNLAANGFRLPTEAEWEKAARGGGTGLRFPWGNLIHTNQAQYVACPNCLFYDLGPSNTPAGPSPVGSFDVNGYGLYDMSGNEFEWCWDWYGTPYGQPSPINPTGAGSASGERMLRGGAWGVGASYGRCADRGYHITPAVTTVDIGFRCVRGL